MRDAGPGRKAASVVVVLALAYSACLYFLAGGYAIDDTWIHLQFARNLAGGYGLRFDPASPPVYACSSPLWVLLLTPAYVAGLGGIATARLLSSLASGACVAMAWALAAGTRQKPLMRVALPLFVALDPWMIRWGSSGMETSLAAMLVMGWMLAVLPERKSPLVAGLLAGLAFLARPELIFLGPLTLLFDGGVFRRAAPALVPWAVLTAGWMATALTIFGSILPSAAAAKAQVGPLAGYLLRGLSELAGAVGLSHGPMLLALVAGISKTSWRTPGERSLFLPALLPILLLALLIAGRAPLLTRYFLPVFPVVTVLAALQLRTGRLLGRKHMTTFVICTALWQVSAGAIVVWPHMRHMTDSLRIYHEVAEDMRNLTPEGSLIAVQEIGVFGYESGRRLLDLGGLISPQVTAESFPGIPSDPKASLAFLREQGATHYLDPHGAIEPLMNAWDRLGVRFTVLGSWDFPGGTSLSARTSYTRVLYRLDWEDCQ